MSYYNNAVKLKNEIDINRNIVKAVNSAGGLHVSKASQSDKLGFDWVRSYIGDILVMTEYIPQSNPAGTFDNPIAWSSEIVLIQNAFYSIDGEIKVWTGSSGETTNWNDSRLEPF